MVEKLLFGVHFHAQSPDAPLESNLEIFEFFSFSDCQPASISILYLEIRLISKKVIVGVFFSRKYPGCSPGIEIENFSMFPHSSSCRRESIGILFVRIG